jgi:hypothetical protein
MLRRLVLIPLLAFGFGFAIATVKGHGGGLLDAVGNLSAPWLLVAFLPGLRTRSIARGALAGVAATMLALAGFYLAVGLSADYGLHGGLWANIELAFTANRRYLAAGLLSGPLLGAAGSWWSSRSTLRPAPAVGLLLLGEPVVIMIIAVTHVLNIYAGYAYGWRSHSGPYIAEFLTGTIILVAARLLPRRRATQDDH